MDRPVEAGHAVVALDARALDHDVVAGLAVVVGVVAPPFSTSWPMIGRVEEQLGVFAGNAVEASPPSIQSSPSLPIRMSPPSPPSRKSLPGPAKISLPSGPAMRKSWPSSPNSRVRPEPPG